MNVEGWAADFDHQGRVIVVHGVFRKISTHQYTLLSPNADTFNMLVEYRPLEPRVFTNVYDTMDDALNAVSEEYLRLILDAQHDIVGWSRKMTNIRKAQGEIHERSC